MPGGPTRVRIAPLARLSSSISALLAQLAHGDELGDPPLHVLEAGVVGVEHLAGVSRVEPLLGALAPRHRDQPVEVAADHRALGRLLALALEPPQLLLGLLGDRLRHLRLGDLALVLGDQVGLVLAQLLADRLHLFAQEVVALLFLGAGLDVVADLAPHLQLGQALALQLDRQLEAGGDVDRLQQAQLALVGDVGGEAGGVGQRARLLDRAQEGGDAAVVAAQLEDLLDHGAVFARQLARCARRRGGRRGSPGPRPAGVSPSPGWAAPAISPRCRPTTVATGRPRRESPVSITSATTPTRPYSPSRRGIRKTRSSSPTSIGRVAVTVGKTIASSSAISR